MGRMGLACVFIGVSLLWSLVAFAQDQDPSYAAAAERVTRLMAFDTVVWPCLNSRATGKIPQSVSSQSASPVLTETAQAEDPLTRARGLEGLAQTAGPENIDTFVKALSDPLPEVRDIASRILAKLESGLVFDKVMEILCDGPAELMGGVQEALPVLKGGLESRLLGVLDAVEEPPVRRRIAAYCLGRMNSVMALPVLAAGAWSDDPDMAQACANALLGIRDPLAVPKLAELIGHPVAEIRWGAMQAISIIGGVEAVQVLGRIAMAPPGEDEAFGRQAVFLLGETKGLEAVPALIDVMRTNLSARATAAQSLRKITGDDAGELPSDWAQWYERKQLEAKRPTPLGPPTRPVTSPWEIEGLPPE